MTIVGTSPAQTGMPRIDEAIVDPQTGMLARVWRDFFIRITNGKGKPVNAIVPGASPYSYPATVVGSVVVRGGTVSRIDIVRGADTVNTGLTQGIIPVAVGDSVKVTYTIVPTMTFIPGPGQ